MQESLSYNFNILHVMHGWGGGLERWVNDFCRFDKRSHNFQLRSMGVPGVPGKEIHLSKSSSKNGLQPIKVWKLDKPITSTSIYSTEYQIILEEILNSYQIDFIIISSFIGHSLDLLSFGQVHKIIVCHDYYPFCPAINIYFDSICSDCKGSRLKGCFGNNNFNRFFPLANAEEWLLIRRSYLDLVGASHIPLVVPSASVERHLKLLAPSLQISRFVEISHGFDNQVLLTPSIQSSDSLLNVNYEIHHAQRPRIVILGSLALHKGLNLFKEIYQEIIQFADVYLIGSGSDGEIFSKEKGIHFLRQYSQEDLPILIKETSPDLALLLSVWPETFSYTLSELFTMRIPVLATNVGSFQDRIINNVNGFLVEPSSDKILEKVKSLFAKYPFSELYRIKNDLRDIPHRDIGEMIDDYYRLMDRLRNEPLDYRDSQSQSLPLEVMAEQAFHHPRSSDISWLRDSVLLPRQLKIDFDAVSITLSNSNFELSRSTPLAPLDSHTKSRRISKRVPLTNRFSLLKSVKSKFPETWEYCRINLVKLGILS